MKNRFLFIPVVILVFIAAAKGQTCSCDSYHIKVYSLYNAKNLQLRVCGDLIDTYGQDKVITEFFITDCRNDTMVDNQIHNEGQAFLLRPFNNGFSIISIDVPCDEKDPVSSKFPSVTYYIAGSKFKIRTEEVPSKPIIAYLKKFKKYQQVK